MIKEVLLIFKTHLDIGFTDYAENVINNYIEKYIPSAIDLAYELKDTDTPFIWTTGSWLIEKALKTDKEKKLEKAICDGLIKWHGLPFTTHTEMMNEELFCYGLSISKKLDERFGVKTTGAKLTDVPGHTVGMVKHLCDAGIKFLHIGVNPATPVPEVPELFDWEYKGKKVRVMYQGDYGAFSEFDDFAVGFGHTGDNKGPQSAEEIKSFYKKVRQMYPEAKVICGTLDDLEERISKIENVPVISKEIGDTWIHGIGTDPKKLSKFRTLQRKLSGKMKGFDLSDNLLLVPEHTWGMNVQINFDDVSNWEDEKFRQIENTSLCERIKKSWQEQRNYIDSACRETGFDAEYEVQKPCVDDWEEVCPDNLGVEISWQLFDKTDYWRYEETYMRCFELWPLWDFTKMGLPKYKGGIFTAKPVREFKKENKKVYLFAFGDVVTEKYGLPEVWLECEDEMYTLKWFGRKPSRLPQAFWLKFTQMEENWEISKMGEWIKPEDIIYSNLISGFDKGVRNSEVEIESYDAGLCAPYGRHLLKFNISPKHQDMYFNLYNNIWNTNFPMWYFEDSIFRFKVSER